MTLSPESARTEAAAAQLARALLATSVSTGRRLISSNLGSRSLGRRSLGATAAGQTAAVLLPLPGGSPPGPHSRPVFFPLSSINLASPRGGPSGVSAWAQASAAGLLTLSCRTVPCASSRGGSENYAGQQPASAPAQYSRSPRGWPADDDLHTSAGDDTVRGGRSRSPLNIAESSCESPMAAGGR
jgi:hypothetical protein